MKRMQLFYQNQSKNYTSIKRYFILPHPICKDLHVFIIIYIESCKGAIKVVVPSIWNYKLLLISS